MSGLRLSLRRKRRTSPTLIALTKEDKKDAENKKADEEKKKEDKVDSLEKKTEEKKEKKVDVNVESKSKMKEKKK